MTRRLELVWRTPEHGDVINLTITRERITVKVPHDCDHWRAGEYLDQAEDIASLVPEDTVALRRMDWDPDERYTHLRRSNRHRTIWGVYDVETHTMEKEDA